MGEVRGVTISFLLHLNTVEVNEKFQICSALDNT